MMRRMGRPGLVGTMARTAVIAGTATAVSGGMRNRQAAKAQAAQDQATPAPAAPEPAAADVDLTGELTKLADMKAQGLLSDEEFAAAKAKVLAG